MSPTARVLRGERTSGARTVDVSEPMTRAARIVRREEMEAIASAARIVERAHADAAAALDDARAVALARAADAAEEARADAEARGAARWIAVRLEEERRLVRDADRIVSLAVAVAERLLGEALAIDPSRIAEVARVVLAEARGVRRAVIQAHPIDAQALREHLRAGGLRPGVDEDGGVVVRDAADLARGDLRLQTDLGPIDARLGTRLDRLAQTLRDAIGAPDAREGRADG